VKHARALAAIGVAIAAFGLAGCISIFPKVPPAQLYAFGENFPSAQALAGASFNVLRVATGFTRAAAGDRVLTKDGQQAAYIAGSRWVSPAAILFDEAETRAFESGGGPARLIRRGESVGATAELRLEVQTFEARYPGRLNAAPTVVVEVRAVLVSVGDRRMIDTKIFQSSQTVGANRVGEIARGFDAATVDVLNQIVAWTNRQAATAAAPQN
jgi:cholesterol transport system auxiliary component